MSAHLLAARLVLAGLLRSLHVVMPWFAPFAVFLGALGTKTGLELRDLSPRAHRDRSWWLIVILAWLPVLYWVMAQFVPQA